MNTALLHQKIEDIIYSATTKIDAELFAIGASIFCAQLMEETGVDIGSWDSEISDAFHKYSIVHSLHHRIETEISLLMQSNDRETVEYMESEIIRPAFQLEPVTLPPVPTLEVFYQYPMGLTRTAEEAVIACGDSPLGHALALTTVTIAEKLGTPSDQNRLFLLDGPEVVHLPGTICKRAIELKRNQHYDQANDKLMRYVTPINR